MPHRCLCPGTSNILDADQEIQEFPRQLHARVHSRMSRCVIAAAVVAVAVVFVAVVGVHDPYVEMWPRIQMVADLKECV